MLNQTTLRAAAALTITAMLAGCATAPMNPNGVRQDYPQGGQHPQANTTDDDPCSVGTTAAAGAAVGALLGALVSGKNGALKGAAIGGGLAAAGCLAINVNSRQTKTAAQADRYPVAGVGVVQLPTMMIGEQIADGSLLPLMEQWRPQRDRKSTRLNSSHTRPSRMPSSA